jgi:Zn-dependent protease with chaperone function
LLIACGFFGLFERRLFAVLWLVAAGIVALAGTILLRSAQGIKLRRVKSGTLNNRAMFLAKKVGVKLKRVYVVPSGRGGLTNAFGSSQSVAMTDNFGEYLHGPQLDFVIGHELGHAKNKHTRKKFIGLGVLFSVLALFSALFAPLVPRLQPLLLPIVLLVPLLAFYAVSRRFEYQCDREAVLLTGNPEAGVRALAALYVKASMPIQRSGFVELFMTHPKLLNRISAIARAGDIPETRLSEILFDSGILRRESRSQISAPQA